jgi:hypothetical protein
MLALSKGLDRVGVSLSSVEDGNRSSFRSVVFWNYLQFRKLVEVHESSASNNQMAYSSSEYSSM